TRAGVLISGSGSNLQALIDACANPLFPAEIAVVISNKADAGGLARAKKAGIPAQVIDHTQYANRRQFDEAMTRLLNQHLVDVVCLAGFMRLLSDEFVQEWRDKLLNIHPSLLPAFKGAHAHRDALAAGVKVSGCTVHFVRPEMDVGPIIIQAAVPVLEGDTQEALAARVLVQEHRCYPQALQWFAQGRLTVENERVRVANGAASSAAVLTQPCES
ncbi:MAG: phosphoribosylglycinamide formyltransferase, partial [Rickettsiales bacterium]|nr:phosphoribosylglycinamide formyltransferase [Rickettsiales bacterium]